MAQLGSSKQALSDVKDAASRCFRAWTCALWCAVTMAGCGDDTTMDGSGSDDGTGDATDTPGMGGTTGSTSATGTDGDTGDTTDTGGTTDTGTGTDGGEGCVLGTTETPWASTCRTEPEPCTAGSWVAPAEGSDGHPLRAESEHFAIYWFESDPDGADPLEGVATPPSDAQVQAALDSLEGIWDVYFDSPIFFPEPYCDSETKYKAAVHFDDFYPLWGGGWGDGKMGLWVSPATVEDWWGLAHEFAHGVQSTTPAFPDAGPTSGWFWESHANWMPHQIRRDETHCSEGLVNAPHLYYGSQRNRYCNWQFFEYLKDRHCYDAVNQIWAADAPGGETDMWKKLMANMGWSIEDLNDLFGEWAMHNVTWDYRDPPPTARDDQGAVYRANYGSLLDDPGPHVDRHLRLTRLEALDDDWATNRRFVSPYYWAPQRWGYNVVQLHPESGADAVTVTFRGVVQSDADSGWRWGLVATDPDLTTARYSPLQSGAEGELEFCVNPDERLFLVVVGTPTTYHSIPTQQPSDGTPYPDLYRFPYMVQVEGAWPGGFRDGAHEPCPAGTVEHANGGGCATAETPASVYVGPHARILGGTVTGDARIEDQATVVGGTVSGGTVGGMSIIVDGFTVSDDAIVQSTFMHLGAFEGKNVSGQARLLGDLEYRADKSANTFYGLVTEDWDGVPSVTEVTTPPPYSWP